MRVYLSYIPSINTIFGFFLKYNKLTTYYTVYNNFKNEKKKTYRPAVENNKNDRDSKCMTKKNIKNLL